MHDSLIDIYNNPDFSLFDTSGTAQSAFSSVSWSIFINKQNQTKQFKINLGYSKSQKKMFHPLDLVVGNRFKFFLN